MLELAAEIRAADAVEVFLSHRHSALEAAENAVARSRWSIAMRLGGRLVWIAGVGGPHYGGTWSPWMLGTDLIKKYPFAVSKYSRPVVQEMRRGADRLENYVHADNMVAKRWLAWCGFTVHAAAPHGPFGAPFHRFEMPGLPGEDPPHV